MKRYEVYKSSGIEWIGEIPKHWEVKRLKFNTYIKARVGWHGLRSDEFSLNDGVYCVTGTDFMNGKVNWETCYRVSEDRYNEDPYIQLREDDLLITKDGTIGKVAVAKHMKERATLNSGVFVVRPQIKEYSTDFMYWVLQSEVFTEFVNFTSKGSTIIHLYQDTFFNLPFILPSLEEQSAIANFLDDKTAKIDKLISNKQKLIELLKEEKTAVINEAVSGEGKDWDKKRLKYVGKAIIGITYSPDDVLPDERGILVLRSSNIQDGRLSFLDNVFVSLEVKEKHLTKEGDILICARNGSAHLVGKCALIDKQSENRTWGAFMSIFRSEYGNFLYYYFNSDLFKRNIGMFSTSTVFQLTSETLHNLLVAFPKKENEMKQIVQQIQTETQRIDDIISKIEREIELMTEYRTALISEVVTGKIKVA